VLTNSTRHPDLDQVGHCTVAEAKTKAEATATIIASPVPA
jgi:hypothetical protein